MHVLEGEHAGQWELHLHAARDGQSLAKTVHELPREQDQELAALKLSTMGVSIDKLTEEQKVYANDYSAGT